MRRHTLQDGRSVQFFFTYVDVNSSKVSRKTSCIVRIYQGDTQVSVIEGIAECSIHDRFCKKMGRKYSFQRAMDIAKETNTFSKHDIKELWDVYLYRGQSNVARL